MTRFLESTVESAALAWLEAVGWRVAHGADIAPDMPGAERRDYGEVVRIPKRVSCECLMKGVEELMGRIA